LAEVDRALLLPHRLVGRAVLDEPLHDASPHPAARWGQRTLRESAFGNVAIVASIQFQLPMPNWKLATLELATFSHWQHSQPFVGIFIADSSAFAPQHALTRETDTAAFPSLRSSIRPTAFEPTATSPKAMPSGGTTNLGAAKATEEMRIRKQHRQQEPTY
jgi:hypothetical protein